MSSLANSLKKNKLGIMIMVASAVCTSFGQFFWKLSLAHGTNLLLLFVGFVFYGFGALFMMTAFKFGSFSVIHPMLSLGYIFAFIIGSLFLKEAVTAFKITGLLFILFGVVMIGVGDE